MSSVHPPRPGRGHALLPLCVAIVCAGLALIVAEHWYLRGRREDRLTDRDERQRAARVEAAQVHMARGNWDEAIRLLEEAAAGSSAGPSAAGARALLPQARRGQAEVLFEAARAALAARDVPRGRRLLNEYVAHPHAASAAEARALQAEVTLALSDAEAPRRLASLSEATLGRFERGEGLPQGVGPATASLRPLFEDTCRRHLAAEKERRAARRDRLRATAAFRDLRAFVKQLARQQVEEAALAARQGQALEQLFVQVGVNDRAEQEALRADLIGPPTGRAFAARLEHKRAEVKRAFRSSPERQPGDEEVFDRLVDEEPGPAPS